MKSNIENNSILPDEIILSKIYYIREQKVMLDQDLAELYEVETRRLNEQVKRNFDRFPQDFMFHLTKEEFENLKSQIAISRWGGRRKLPFAFTEHGVLMLSSILNSKRAIRVNIQIMRVYVKIRQYLLSNGEVYSKLDKLDDRITEHDENIAIIFEYLKQLEQNKENEEKQKPGKRLAIEHRSVTLILILES